MNFHFTVGVDLEIAQLGFSNGITNQIALITTIIPYHHESVKLHQQLNFSSQAVPSFAKLCQLVDEAFLVSLLCRTNPWGAQSTAAAPAPQRASQTSGAVATPRPEGLQWRLGALKNSEKFCVQSFHPSKVLKRSLKSSEIIVVHCRKPALINFHHY